MVEPLPELFTSPEHFRGAFVGGLSRLIESGGMNLFILVSANASLDEGMFDTLRSSLGAEYRRLRDGLRSRLETGIQPLEDDDDLLVFLKIAAIGFEQLKVAEQRNCGLWEVQFNQLRAFRPQRNSQKAVQAIRLPFDENGFHFNREFLRDEAIWSGRMFGYALDLYYNKYPFVESHCLLVPQREDCLPQYLTSEIHRFAWNLTRILGERMPGLRIGYNALGAFASVNHLHLQMFVRERGLPVEDPAWAHNSGDRPYPLPCRCFEDPGSAWGYIERLHEANVSYNLLYVPGRLFCLPRKKQGDVELPDWSAGFSWYELCGGVIAFNHRVFTGLNEPAIHSALEGLMPDAGDL